jgi:hypothetical protein
MTDVATEEPTQELPTLDIQLLRDLVFWAEGDNSKYQEIWEQHSWAHKTKNGVCQTAFCIAGQAVAQANIKLQWDEVEEEILETGETKHHYYASFTEHGEFIDEVAAKLIGLTQEEAEELFEGENGIEEVRAVASSICASRGLTL